MKSQLKIELTGSECRLPLVTIRRTFNKIDYGDLNMYDLTYTQEYEKGFDRYIHEYEKNKRNYIKLLGL